MGLFGAMARAASQQQQEQEMPSHSVKSAHEPDANVQQATVTFRATACSVGSNALANVPVEEANA
eukprot:3085879-Amphidinium_carterae.1